MESASRGSTRTEVRRVRIDPVTRIRGHADIEILFAPDDTVIEARFRALEFRGFEQMVKGMNAFRAPQFLSRICGSCGFFHQLASCMAIEEGTGTRPPVFPTWFRELLGWLSMGMACLMEMLYLALPDFALPMSDTTVRNVEGIYRIEQEAVGRMARVQSVFAESLSLLGGLPVHPPIVVPGGVSYLPNVVDCMKVGEWLGACEDDLKETLRLIEMLTKRNTEMIDTESPLEGFYMTCGSGKHPALIGDCLAVGSFAEGDMRYMRHAELLEAVQEESLPWTYVRPVHVSGFAPLLVGSLARANIGFDTDTPWAESECTKIKERWGQPLDRELLFLATKCVDVLWSWEKARLLLEQRPRKTKACIVPELSNCEGLSVVESPCGIIAHHVDIGADGCVAAYRVLSPLQFNHALLNRHLTGFAGKSLGGTEVSDSSARLLELAARAFCPCVPCGTH